MPERLLCFFPAGKSFVPFAPAFEGRLCQLFFSRAGKGYRVFYDLPGYSPVGEVPGYFGRAPRLVAGPGPGKSRGERFVVQIPGLQKLLYRFVDIRVREALVTELARELENAPLPYAE